MTWTDDNAPWLSRAHRNWSPYAHRPWRLRLWFASPIAHDGREPITLEGLLQFIVVWREAGRSPDDVFAALPKAETVDVPIPIADVQVGDEPIACVSAGWWPAIAEEGIRFRRKRADVDALGVETIMINGGWGKSLNIPVATLVTPYLDFALRGDRGKLDALLADAGGLGRDSTRGLGTVLGWEWAEDADDRSLLYRGAPQRVLPRVEDGSPFDVRALAAGSFDERVATTRAPYWIQKRARLCVVPVQPIGEAF